MFSAGEMSQSRFDGHLTRDGRDPFSDDSRPPQPYASGRDYKSMPMSEGTVRSWTPSSEMFASRRSIHPTDLGQGSSTPFGMGSAPESQSGYLDWMWNSTATREEDATPALEPYPDSNPPTPPPEPEEHPHEDDGDDIVLSEMFFLSFPLDEEIADDEIEIEDAPAEAETVTAPRPFYPPAPLAEQHCPPQPLAQAQTPVPGQLQDGFWFRAGNPAARIEPHWKDSQWWLVTPLDYKGLNKMTKVQRQELLNRTDTSVANMDREGQLPDLQRYWHEGKSCPIS